MSIVWHNCPIIHIKLQLKQINDESHLPPLCNLDSLVEAGSSRNRGYNKSSMWTTDEGFSCWSTGLNISQHQSPSIVQFYVLQKRRPADLEAPEWWNVRSGSERAGVRASNLLVRKRERESDMCTYVVRTNFNNREQDWLRLRDSVDTRVRKKSVVHC